MQRRMFTQFTAVWRLMEGQRLRYVAAIAALVIASCFLYLAPVVPQITIDGVLAHAGEGVVEASRHDADGFTARVVEMLGGRAYIADNLWWPGLLVVLLTAIAGLFTYVRGKWSAQASEAIARRVRDRVYDHLQRLPSRYFDTHETGDLIQRCTSDVETLRTFLSMHVVEIGRAMIMFIAPLPLMLAIDVRMTIASVVLLPPIVLFSYIFFRNVKTIFKQTDEAEGRLTTNIQENLTGIRVVRAFARQAFEQEKFSRTNGEHRALDYRLYKLMSWFWSTSDVLCLTQKALVVFAGVYFLANGTLQVGAFFYFITVVTMFLWPMRMMGRILTDLGKAQVALTRLDEILHAPVETSPDDPVDVAELTGEIEFEHVHFAHASAPVDVEPQAGAADESRDLVPVLNDVSFHVPAGQSLAILGPSGCGKSTIVNLLLRLYDYDRGSIRIDGHALSRLDRQFVRGQMSVVMQEPFLYSKSLRENLRLARPSAGDDEIIEAATIASVHDSIAEFSDGYDTLVGERGVTLSGGQRQRVALARALLKDPAVLILDDALSAVDTETEAMILDALQQREGRHTTIIIAHRLSTVMHADQIIVMEHGRIVQRGTHADLLAEDGMYRRLWNIQNSLESDFDHDIAGGPALSRNT